MKQEGRKATTGKMPKPLRILALFLCLVMVLELLPASALAASADDTLPLEDADWNGETSNAEDASLEATEPEIVGEVESLRAESQKHFRMSDGSFLAVSYGVPVHYQDEAGDWVDIDNTLTPVTTYAGDTVYTTSNGNVSTAFSASLQDGQLYSSSYGNASVTMGLVDPFDAAQLLAEPSDNVGEIDATQPEEITAPTEAAEASAPTAAEETIAPAETEGSSEPTEAVETSIPAEAQEAEATQQAEVTAEIGMDYNRDSVAEILDDTASLLALQEPETNAELIPDTLSSTVVYEDVFAGVDLSYNTYGYNIKESIVVKEPLDSYRFYFRLQLDGLTAQLRENGSISLTDEAGSQIYEIPAPYMVDAGTATSNAVSYSLTEVDGGVLLCVEADKDWINAEGRSFPVTIDPTLLIKAGNADGDIYATYVEQGNPDSGHGSYQDLYFGYTTYESIKERQIYLYVNNLPALPQDSVVANATLNLWQFDYTYVGMSEMRIGAYEVTGSKPSSSSTYRDWIYYMTWNSKPAYDSQVLDYTVSSKAVDDGYLSWDLTGLVNKWYKTSTKNRTIALVGTERGSYSGSNCAVPVFYAYGRTKPPILTVSYRNTTGIEPYYTYATLGAGAAGTAYIADYTGQLKVAKSILSYASTVNPYTLSLTYNSDYFATKTTSYHPMQVDPMDLGMSIGSGISLNAAQRVDEVPISGTTYLRYIDGDGTVHYFAKDAEKDPDLVYYYDEDGLGLKIKQVTGEKPNTYVMSDDKGNTWEFTYNYLKNISDENGNQIIIRYNADRGVDTISQKNNGCGETTIAKFTYNGKAISTIKDASGTVYTFGYTNGDLTSIKRGNTTIAEYTYSNHRLTQMKDTESGYALNFSYAGGKVSHYHESTGTTTGAQVDISYSNQSQTTYRDYGKNRKGNDGDDILTCYSFDYAGRTANVYSTDHYGGLLGASNAAYSGTGSTKKDNNRTLRTASIGRFSQSYMQNCGFESSGYWWFGGADDAVGSSVSMSTENPRTGNKSLKGYLPAGKSGAMGASEWSYELKAGTTYTFSGYINTSKATAFNGTGVFLGVRDSGNQTTWRSRKINYKTNTSIDGGWERVSVTFTAEVSGKHYLIVWNDNVTGTFYADDMQMEYTAAISNKNLLENGHMQYSGYAWTLGSGFSFADGRGYDTSRGLKAVGNPKNDVTAYQDVPINLPGTQTYVLSGWAKANAVPDNVQSNKDAAEDTVKQFGLRAILTYADGGKEYHYVPFNPQLTDWQFASLTIVPKQPGKKVASIRVVCAYEKNANTAYFDNLALMRETAQTMKYDENGNLVSVTSTGLKEDTDEYAGGNLIKTVTGGNGIYEYTYDETLTHRLTSVTDGHVTQSFGYDDAGNATSTTLEDGKKPGEGSLKMKTSATYTNNKNLVSQITDANGGSVKYTYGTGFSKMTGLPTAVTDALGTTVNHTYDAVGRTSKSYVANSASLGYTYTNGNLTALSRTGAQAGQQQYNFTYDAFGNMTKMQVGSRTLASYTYYAGNGPVTKQTYGNGNTISYTYDYLGRLKTVTYSGGRTLTYVYDGNGQVYTMTDSATGGTTTYVYDALGRLASAGESASGSRSGYTYDNCGRLKGFDYSYPGLSTASERYYYNTDSTDAIPDGLLTAMSMVDWKKINLTYDALERLSSRNIAGKVTQTYAYAAGGADDTTTPLVSTYESKYNSNQVAKFTYTYDKAGNITRQTASDGTYWAYAYDVLGEMQFATSYGSNGIATARYKYYYDAAGNIKSREITNHDNSKVLESHTYTYGDANWKDLLTAFDGKTITYDQAGNPTSYYDGSTLVWKEGRRLQSITKDGKTASYLYNADGQRTKKTYPDGSYTKFCVVDGRVVGEIIYKKTANGVKWSHGMRYIYGDDGSVIGFGLWDANTTNEWERYYFIKNLQGDVLKVYRDADNALVASYTYDPFGNILTKSGEMADENPFRYRGYYYDTETGFYYLKSRYYDPLTCRFINADSYASTGQDIIGYNMFAYCMNNPVNMSDPSGNWPKWLTDAVNWVANALGITTSSGSVATTGSSATAKGPTFSRNTSLGIVNSKASGSLGYATGSFRGQATQTGSSSAKSMIGGFGKASVLNVDSQNRIGTQNVGISKKDVLDIGTVTAQAGIQYKDGLGVSLGAKASVAAARGTYCVDVFGWKVEVGMSAQVLSYGYEFAYGALPEGGWGAKQGASNGLFGYSYLIRITPP